VAEPPREITALRDFGLELRRVAESDAIGSGPGVARRTWARVALLVLAVGALAGIALTPPGRAVAERVGELVGIGEPSSVQETNLRDPRLTETQERLGPALVAASGTIPGTDQSFEIVAWAARQKPRHFSPAERATWRARLRLLERARRDNPRFFRKRARRLNPGASPVPSVAELERMLRERTADPATGEPQLLSCLGIVYPDLGSQETGKWCAGPSTDQVISSVHVFGMGGSDPRFGPDAPYQIIGVTKPDVDRVEVTYLDETGSRVKAPVTLGRLDGELLEKTGAQIPFGFFAAFIPYDGVPHPPDALSPSPALHSHLLHRVRRPWSGGWPRRCGRRLPQVL
jgi:hypothetical protein